MSVQCRLASRVKTKQAWHAAVRHTGLLFKLPLPPTLFRTASTTAATLNTTDTSPNAAAESSKPEGEAGVTAAPDALDALPYPQLSQTVSSANFAPAAHLAEHYSPPGGPFCIPADCIAVTMMLMLTHVS